MRKHGGIPSRRDKHVTLAANSPPGFACGRFVGGHKSGLAGCKSPPLFKRGASSGSSQRQRQREPWGASPRPSAPTYLPTGFTPHELFHGGRPAWFFKTPFPEDFKSPVGDWPENKQSMANKAGTNLRNIRDRELSRRNRLRRPASFKVGDLVLVHHSRLPSWPRNCLQDPYFRPYLIIRIDGSRW